MELWRVTRNQCTVSRAEGRNLMVISRNLSHRITTLAVLFSGFITGCTINESVGPEGRPGAPGNANVFSLGLRFEMIDAEINGTVASAQYTVPDLSISVVDEGAVLLFFRDQETWTAMPYTFGVESVEVPAVDIYRVIWIRV